MGSHFKERLYEPTTRLVGMFVKFPTMETMEILASLRYDFVIIDMEHAPLNVETVYSMIVTSERSGMAALVRLRGHDTATANMFLDAGASGILVPHCSPYGRCTRGDHGHGVPTGGTTWRRWWRTRDAMGHRRAGGVPARRRRGCGPRADDRGPARPSRRSTTSSTSMASTRRSSARAT